MSEEEKASNINRVRIWTNDVNLQNCKVLMLVHRSEDGYINISTDLDIALVEKIIKAVAEKFSKVEVINMINPQSN